MMTADILFLLRYDFTINQFEHVVIILTLYKVYRHKYYVATDQCGTPIMVFNQYGEGIREIMRSPYGHIVYDSNPYLYLPVDFCGGLLDQVILRFLCINT